jgi:Tol biopolymer transport system component
MTGCGGGGGERAAIDGPAIGDNQTHQVGPLVVQTEKTGKFKADTIPTNGECSFLALYGAQINYLASTAMMDRLVYTGGSASVSNLYISNFDGSGATRLTNNNAWEITPRWSPDGTKIAFARRWPGEKSKIYTINADGSDARILTPDTSTNRLWPGWSPDGGRIVYMAEMNPSKYILQMIYSENGYFVANLTLVANNSMYPDWSPNGKEIVYATTQYDGLFELALVEYPGAITRLTYDNTGYTAPAWDPTGTYISFQTPAYGASEIGILRRDGADRRSFTSHSAADQYPRYSSDGRYIFFISNRSHTDHIWVQEVVEGPGDVVGPARAWRALTDTYRETYVDAGSPTVQTQRVLIGAPGTDLFANHPIWDSAPAAIVALDRAGYRNFVRIGVAAAHLAGMQINPLPNPGIGTAGVEVSAAKIANLREDRGLGQAAQVWDFTALNPGMVLLYLDSNTGKLTSVMPIKDMAYPASAGASAGGSQPIPYASEAEGDGVRLTGAFAAVFDAKGHNLAPSGASSVTLGAEGQVLSVN